MTYRGRIAPTPTGLLHLGHAATFLRVEQRARIANGVVVMRIEDIDPLRCKPEYTGAALEDLRWLGIQWQEGPDIGGPYAPYCQSKRADWFLEIWQRLKNGGFIYPCSRSRRDVESASQAPHAEDDAEPIFPPEWRPAPGTGQEACSPIGINWRFRIPDGKCICFQDANKGELSFEAGTDFGDFIVWRRDNVPAYELAVVADDHAMNITEVVRGEDLLKSTARQILLYRALGWQTPQWMHTPLLLDDTGRRLAKRHAALSLRALREQGRTPEEVRRMVLDFRKSQQSS